MPLHQKSLELFKPVSIFASIDMPRQDRVVLAVDQIDEDSLSMPEGLLVLSLGD